MSTGRLEVMQIIPGPKNVARLVQRFGQNDYGLVTSLVDSQLPMLRSQLDEKTMVDVKSFGEVVRQIHILTGNTPRRIASSRQVLSALELVCNDIDSGSPFRRVADMPGFHEALLEVFRELGHWGVIGSHYESLAAKLKSHGYLERAEELIGIMNQVIEVLESANSTTVSKLISECLDATIDSDGQDSRLLIFMGSTVHPMALQWIRWLVSEGAQVQVVVDRHATDGNIFLLADSIVEDLGANTLTPGEGNRLLNNLFAKQDYPGADLDWVEIHCCGDPLAECEWALRKCLEIGAPGRTAIFSRNLDLYGPLLVHAGESLGVPIETRRRIPLLASGFAKVSLAILRAIAGDDIRALSTPFETSYFGISDSQDLLGKIHDDPAGDWEALEQVLLSEQELTDYSRSVYEHLLAMRKSIADKSQDVAGWHSELKTFLESAPWLEHVQERDLRAQTSMLSNLAQDATIQLVRRKEKLTYAEWLSHASGVWDLSDVSVPGIDEGVLLVSSPEELAEVDTLLVLGMLEGSFPRRRSENAILSDALKSGISEVIGGIPLNTSFDVARSERDLFYRVCASPSKALYFSYPMSDGESDNVPAFYLEEIKKICGLDSSIVHPRRHLTPPIEQCKSPRDLALAERFSSAKIEPVDNTLELDESIELVKFDMAGVEPRSLRSMLECNFKFSAERLMPKQVSISDHWGWMLEVPRRAKLLTIPDIRAARTEMNRVLTEYLDEIRPRLPEWEFEMINHGAPRLIDGLIEREFRSRSLWGRNAENTSLNVRFGDSRLNPERFKYQLTGQVDGVTDYDGVRTIHLYRRTPPKDSKPEQLDKYLAEYGLYFASAWDGVREVRIEIDGLSEHRTTLLFSEIQTLNKEGDQYVVLNLANQFGNKIELAERIKDLLRLPKQIAVSGQMTTRAGDHCQFCSYSDLCRQSLGSADDFFEGGKTSAK